MSCLPFLPKDSHTSTRGRSIGSSTTRGWEWSKATQGLFCMIFWAATAYLPTPTGTGALHRKKNRHNMTMMTLISYSSWRAAVEQRKRWPSPSPASWPCVWWFCLHRVPLQEEGYAAPHTVLQAIHAGVGLRIIGSTPSAKTIFIVKSLQRSKLTHLERWLYVGICWQKQRTT